MKTCWIVTLVVFMTSSGLSGVVHGQIDYCDPELDSPPDSGRAHYKLEAEQSSEIVIIPSGLLSSTLDTLALARLILT